MTRPTQLLGFYREVQARLQKNIDNQMAKVQEDIRVKRYQDSLLVIRMRDSLFQVSLFIKQRDRIRHLFFLPESDSTIDQPVPYNFRNSARQLEEDLHIWRMHYLQVDSHDISREYDR